MQIPPGSAIELKARRHIDAIAEDIVLLDDHVAQIDADPVKQAARCRHVAITPRHALLEFDCAAERFGDALELHQKSIAGGLDDAALAFGDRRVDQLQPHRFEPCEGPRLVDLHETAIANHIRRQNCREPAFYSSLFHFTRARVRTRNLEIIPMIVQTCVLFHSFAF